MINVTNARCSCVRFKDSTCTWCVEICPHKILKVSNKGLCFDESTCTYCMLCVSVCPTGALEEKYFNLTNTIAQITDIPLPVIRCRRNIELKGRVRTSCFGFFSAEYLIILHFSQQKPVQFNMTECGSCSNREIIQIFLNCSKYLPRKRERLNLLIEMLPKEKQRLLIDTFWFFIYFTEVCNGCTACVGLCPTGAISPSQLGKRKPFRSKLCTGCMLCTEFCSQERIKVEEYADNTLTHPAI